MHQDLLQFQTCQTFSMSKTKSQDRDTLKSPWLMSWGTSIENCPFFGNTFEPYPLKRNDTSNLEPKANPFKTILIWEEMLQAGSPSMACVVARSRQTMRTKTRKKQKEKRKKQKERKRKNDCHVMHLKNLTKSKRESQKPNSRKNVGKMTKKIA